MSRVISELDRSFNHVLVHSGQNFDYELNEVFFKDLEIRKPDFFLNVAGETAAETIANVIRKTDDLIKQVKPDAFLIYGDTNTALSVIAAKRNKVPIFHMEAGNRCFDQRVPEEINRKLVDHLSDINLVLTEHARRYLIAEGISQETILRTGTHMREVLDYYLPKVERSDALSKHSLKEREYFLVSVHREENIDRIDGAQTLVSTVNALAERSNYPVVVSTHPRTRLRIEEQENFAVDTNVRFMPPFGFLDYIKLQMNAFCVVSDSGTISEEAALLNLPAVTIRDAHERPEGMDAGILVMSAFDPSDVLESVDLVTRQHFDRGLRMEPPDDYTAINVSVQVARIVQSYTGYVNRTVWRR
jgi:UDP-N-acetylglucosamine 2-epimerase (non-hydrolysing)